MWMRRLAKVLAAVLALNLAVFALPTVETAAVSAPIWDQEIIDAAVSSSVTSMEVNVSFAWKSTLEASEAFYMLALMSYCNPDLTATNGKKVSERLLEHIQTLVSGGKENSCRGGLGGWADNPVAQALVLAKHTPTVWNELSRGEKQKCDFLMQCMAVVGNFTQNYESNPKTDMSQSSTFEKGWNPNIQEGYVGIMAAAYMYFGGADKVNEIFANFSYDEYIAKMDEYNFANVKTYFELTGKDLLENGGTDALGGQVTSARIPFTYKDILTGERVEYEPFALFESLASIMYSKEVVSTVSGGGTVRGYIADGSKSPFEGKIGMCHEFVSMDASGIRTSADYIFKGWRNSVPTRATIKAMGYWKAEEAADTERRMYIGSEDFLYKISDEHGGYVGYSNGKELGAQTESEFAKAGQGWKYIKQVWDKYLKCAYAASVQVTAKNGKIDTSVAFENIAGIDQQAGILVTVYNAGGKLVDMIIQECSIGAEGAKIDLSVDGAKAMVFIRDENRGLELIGKTL